MAGSCRPEVLRPPEVTWLLKWMRPPEVMRLREVGPPMKPIRRRMVPGADGHSARSQCDLSRYRKGREEDGGGYSEAGK